MNFYNFFKSSRAIYRVDPHSTCQLDPSYLMNFRPDSANKAYFDNLLEMLIKDFLRMVSVNIQVNNDKISIPAITNPSTDEYNNQYRQFKKINEAVDELFISHFKTYKIELVDFIRYFFHQGGLMGLSEIFFYHNHIDNEIDIRTYFIQNFKTSSSYFFHEQANGSIDLVVDTTIKYKPLAHIGTINGIDQPRYCLCPRKQLYTDKRPECETSTLQIRYNIDFKPQTGVVLQMKEYKMDASPKLAAIDKMQAHPTLVPRLLANFINFLSSFFYKPKEITRFQHAFELNKYQYERENPFPKLSR